MMNNQLEFALKQNYDLIEREIAAYYSCFNDYDTEEVRNAELYSLKAGGKRIRSFLVNEFCRACGGNTSDSVKYALAVEMIHTFSLIHDDLPCMDDDELRRGKPTSHKVFGEATALLAGDSLAVRAYSVIVDNNSLSAGVNLEAVSILSHAVSSEGMIGGQIIDMRGETKSLDFDTLLKLHSKKTGALIIASALLGCLAANVDKREPAFEAAKNYAQKIGLAFQIIDDILDATADTELLGKNTGVDVDRKKTTFLSFMNVDEAYKYAEKLTIEAKHCIKIIKDNVLLIELADYLLNRNK